MREELLTIGYLDFGKTFDAVSPKIPIEKFMKYGLYKQTVKWIKNRMNVQAQRVGQGLIGALYPWGQY